MKRGRKSKFKRTFFWSRRCVHALHLLEKDIVGLLQKVIGQVFEQKTQDGLIVAVVKKLLREYKSHSSLVVYVSADETALVRESLPSGSLVTVMEDEMLEQGSCKLKGPLGIIEGGVSQTINIFMKNIGEMFDVSDDAKQQQSPDIE